MTLQESLQALSNKNILDQYHSLLSAENAGEAGWLALIAIYESELKYRGITKPSMLRGYINA